MMKFLIVLFVLLLPSSAYAVDVNRFTEKPAPFSDADKIGGRTELDVLQREAESKRNNEAGFVGERLLDDMFWDTGTVSLIRTLVAELKLENDPDFNIHEYMDEFMDGIPVNHTPWFTKRADSYEEAIMLRKSLLDRFAVYEKAEAAGWKGIVAIVVARMVVLTPIVLLTIFVFFRVIRQKSTKNLSKTHVA